MRHMNEQNVVFEQVRNELEPSTRRLAHWWRSRVDDVDAEILAAVWECFAAGHRDPLKLVRAAESRCRSAARSRARFEAPARVANGQQIPTRLLTWNDNFKAAQLTTSDTPGCPFDMAVDRIDATAAINSLGGAPAIAYAWADPSRTTSLSHSELERYRRWRNRTRKQLAQEMSDAA